MYASINEYLKRIKHNLGLIDKLTIDDYTLKVINDLVSIVTIQERNISVLEKQLENKKG